MKKNPILTGCLGITGILTLLIGIALVVFGIVYGYTEDKAFYQRQDDYHALDDQREAMNQREDSLINLRDSLYEVGDTIQSAVYDAELDSLRLSNEYEELFGIPAPPQGFSMAYVVTIILCILALPFLGIGLACLAAWRSRRSEREL